jgi:hypothetical protein
MDELQALYDSEINFTITTFWDAGFKWKLGDDMNGFDAEGEAMTIKEAVEQLCEAARREYPESAFATRKRS